jgi:hypothetical protein
MYLFFVHRFLAIWYPLKCQITKRRARILILIIWMIALTTTIPWALFFDLVSIFHNNPDIQLCLEVWPPGLDGDLYFLLANLLLCYVMPTIMISLCYILIWVRVARRHIPSDTKDAQIERMQQKSKVKVVKMLVAVVILFVLSWLPLYAIFARIKLGGDLSEWEEEILPIATPIAQWLGASNSCINPVLYAFFNKKYRRGFMAILKSRKCCGNLRYDSQFQASLNSNSTRKTLINSSIRQDPNGFQASLKKDPTEFNPHVSLRKDPMMYQHTSIRKDPRSRFPPKRQDSGSSTSSVAYIFNNSGV